MLRFLLTTCALLLAMQCLRTPEPPHRPHLLSVPMTGLCSGDCVSCGCPPAVAASGNCCCTRTRQLRHPHPQVVLAKDFAPTADRTTSLRCAPCNRTPALLPLSGSDNPLLPATPVALVAPLAVRTVFPVPLFPDISRSAPPPSPPPERIA